MHAETRERAIARDLANIDTELRQLQDARDARANHRSTEREAKQAAAASKEMAELEQLQEIIALRNALAVDLKVDVDAVLTVLGEMREKTRAHGGRILAPLARLWNPNNRALNPLSMPDVVIARRARHALVGMKMLPRVKPGDPFGTEEEVRELPPVALDPLACASLAQGGAHRALAHSFGLHEPRELPPACETVQAVAKRLGPAKMTMGMAARLRLRGIDGEPAFTAPEPASAGTYSYNKWKRTPDETVRKEAKARAVAAAEAAAASETDRALADADETIARFRELDLVRARYEIARVQRRAEYQQALVAQRIQIVAACDRAIADLPMGEGWFWARVARKTAALEPGSYRVSDSSEVFDFGIEHIVALAKAHGAHFTFDKGH